MTMQKKTKTFDFSVKNDMFCEIQWYTYLTGSQISAETQS